MTDPGRAALGRRQTGRMIAGLAGAYALATLWLQLGLGGLAPRPDSPVELCMDLAIAGGLAFSLLRLAAAWRDPALRVGWAFAIVGLALVGVSEAADWLDGADGAWYEDARIEAVVWFVAAYCFHRCADLYADRPGVRPWWWAGFTLQLVSFAVDAAHGGQGSSPSGMALELVADYAKLLGLLCYVAALTFTAVASAGGARRAMAVAGPPGLIPARVSAPRAAAPVAVGSLARALYFDRAMFRAARYPTRHPFLHKPGARQAVGIAMAVYFGSIVGPGVRRAGGKPLLWQFVDLLRVGLGHHVDAVSYYLYELYKPDGRREAPYWLTRYETKNGLLTVLNSARPRREGVPFNLTDKLAFDEACAHAGIPTPPILLTAVDGFIDRRAPIDAFDRDLFSKLKRGRGTAETGRFRRVAPLVYVDRGGKQVSLEEIVEAVRLQSLTVVGVKTTPVVIQPRLVNHGTLADLADDSLIVIRFVTCLDEGGKPEITHAMLRVLAKIEPRWDVRLDTEYGAAIDLVTGRLGRMTGDKPETCLDWYDSHPVTGAAVAGRRIERWDELCGLALRAHGLFADRVVIGWDIALTSDGPVVIEGNSNMDVSFIQRGYRDPIGRSRLGELLNHHLSRL